MNSKKISHILLWSFAVSVICATAQENTERGMYFEKNSYDGVEIPVFTDSKSKLPQPIIDENSEWLDMYWKCWELAFKHFKKPPEGSPFVSNILDEAFSKNIFQWDMIFMVMFARYADHVFPAVHSLDNFYCRQHPSGYICREISEKTGEDYVFVGREHTINPPLFSWAEIESFKNTGDKSRFEMVLPVLDKYVEWLNQGGSPQTAGNEQNWYKYGRRAEKSVHNLYWNTGFGSGMDNTPRGGTGWVDMSSQMVIQYNNLAQIAEILGKQEKKQQYKNEAAEIAARINKYCWNEEDGLYYDVDSTGNHVKWKTSGCFWPMLAGIASNEQCDRLVGHLQDTSSFWRNNVFPTLAADQDRYNPEGGYWLGSVWAPTNYMIIKGLEYNGYEELARKASEKYINEMYCVFDSTKTVWENYSPEYCMPGKTDRFCKPDFVGWSGIGPISLLIENVLGFRVDAVNNSLTWRINRTDKHGIKRIRIGDVSLNAICEKRKSLESPVDIKVEVNSDVTLHVILNSREKTFKLDPGVHSLTME